MDDRYIKLVEEIRATLADSTTEQSLSRFVALARQYDIPLATVRLMVKGELNRKKYQEIWGKETKQETVVSDTPNSFIEPSIAIKETVPTATKKLPTVKPAAKDKSKKIRTPLLIVLGLLLLAIVGFLVVGDDFFQKDQQVKRIVDVSNFQGKYEGEYLDEEKKITLSITKITPDSLSEHFNFNGTINVARTYSNATISGMIANDLQEIVFYPIKKKTVTYKVLSRGNISERNGKVQIRAEDGSWEVHQVAQ